MWFGRRCGKSLQACDTLHIYERLLAILVPVSSVFHFPTLIWECPNLFRKINKYAEQWKHGSSTRHTCASMFACFTFHTTWGIKRIMFSDYISTSINSINYKHCCKISCENVSLMSCYQRAEEFDLCEQKSSTAESKEKAGSSKLPSNPNIWLQQ